jgi:rubrerythrin
MTIEEAIKTAIDFEIKIRDTYRDAVQQTEDPTGQKIFQTLADDEQNHVDYLNLKLEEWRSSGRLSPVKLASVVPPKAVIEKEAAKLQTRMQKDDRGVKQQMLSKALKLEIETSTFYRQLVEQLPGEARQLFSRFLEIENNHIDAVQFELDYYGNTGYWFGFEEFDMEAG